MKILADENIPFVNELFSEFADIVTCEGRKISAEKLQDVDVLLVRSVTRVDQALLEGTPVRFVGSATIGLDHIDTNWLEKNDIYYCNAPGCNAIAVAEYVLSGLFVLADKFQLDLRNNKVAIIGAGNVGTALSERLGIIGVPYSLYDPPLQEQGDERTMASFEELAECDIVSLHVPLTSPHESKWPTRRMIGQSFFEAMENMKYLINTSRGEVIDNRALKHWLSESSSSKQANHCILDVWQEEPAIDKELLQQSLIGTPHIAGHSIEGKTRGILMIFHEFCKHFKLEDKVDDATYLANEEKSDIIHLKQDQTFMNALSSAIWSVYDIRGDDKAMKAGLSKDIDVHFDRLRQGYKQRREFSAYRLDPVTLPDGSRRTLTALGFGTEAG